MDGKMFNSQYKPILISFLLFTLLSIFSGNLCRAQDSTDAEKMHLQGHVKSIHEVIYNSPYFDNYRIPHLDISGRSDFFFDRNGNITKKIYYHGDGGPVDTTLVNYQGKFEVFRIEAGSVDLSSFHVEYGRKKDEQKHIITIKENEGIDSGKGIDVYDNHWRLNYSIRYTNNEVYSTDSFFYGVQAVNFIKNFAIHGESINQQLSSGNTFSEKNSNDIIIEKLQRQSSDLIIRVYVNNKLQIEKELDTLRRTFFRREYQYNNLGELTISDLHSKQDPKDPEDAEDPDLCDCPEINERCYYTYDSHGNRLTSDHYYRNANDNLVAISDGLIQNGTVADFTDHLSWEYNYDSRGNIIAQYEFQTQPKKDLLWLSFLTIEYY